MPNIFVVMFLSLSIITNVTSVAATLNNWENLIHDLCMSLYLSL